MKSANTVILLLLLAVCPGSISSQNATFVTRLDSKESIVREFSENVFIVYNNDGTTGTINYIDLNTNIVISARVQPVDVADFEIYAGTAYFCGTAFGTPIAGLFDIVDLFFGGGQIEYILMSNSIPCYPHPNEFDRITNLRKLEVMPVGTDRPHMIMIGEAQCTYPSISDSINRCIIDLYYDGSNWISAMSQAHDGIMYYDDVAVTDNYVVTAGHKHWAEGEYMVVFNRQTTGYQNIFHQTSGTLGAPSFTIPFYMAGGVSQYDPATDEEFLIEHIDGDLFATVCHGTRYSGTTLYEGTVLNLYIASSSGMAVANRYMTPEHSKRYRGLKYNCKSNSLYLLPGQISTCPESYLEFVMDNAKPAVTGALQHTDLSLYSPSFTSLDASPLTLSPAIGQAILSGESNGRLHLWRHLLSGNDECHLESDLPLDNMMRDIGQTDYTIFYNVSVQPFFSITPAIELDELEIKCTN